jgi:hypothetical protein
MGGFSMTRQNDNSFNAVVLDHWSLSIEHFPFITEKPHRVLNPFTTPGPGSNTSMQLAPDFFMEFPKK